MATISTGNFSSGGAGGVSGNGLAYTYNIPTVTFGGLVEGGSIPEKTFKKECKCGYNNKFNDEELCAYCGEKLEVFSRFIPSYNPTITQTLTTGTYALYMGYPYVQPPPIASYLPNELEDEYVDCTLDIKLDPFGREMKRWIDSGNGRVRKLEIWHSGTLLHREKHP